MTRALALVLLVLGSFCFACLRGEVREDAEVVIFIDADEALTPQLAKVVVEVRDEAGLVVADQAEFVLTSALKLPISFGVFQPPGGAGWFMLQARGYDAAGTLLVEYKTITSFVARRTVRLEVTFASACSGKFCEGHADQTCNTISGQCEGVLRQTPIDEPRNEEEAGPIREVSDAGDAGAVLSSTGRDAGDAGGSMPISDAGDAGAPRDAGPDSATTTMDASANTRDGGEAGSADGSNEASVRDASESEAEASAGWGTTLPPLITYDSPGPFATTTAANTGPNGAYTIVRANPLAIFGALHPPLVFGGGIVTTPSTYMNLFTRLASFGYVIICVNSLNGAPGSAANLTAMREGLDWLIAQNTQAGVFQGKLATDHAVAMGYSVGATAAVQLSSHPAVITTVAIHGHNTNGDPRGPVLLLTGSNDVIADVRMTLATLTEAPAILAGLPIGHIDAIVEMESGGRYVVPITAWLRYWVNSDLAAKRFFWGASCDMCASPWLTPESNAPWRAQSL